MYNQNSSPILVGVTFSANTVGNNNGNGIYNQGSSSTLINTLIWGNNSGIYGGGSCIYYSLIEGTTNTTNGVITNDPGTLTFDNHGGRVKTISIATDSPAKDAGAYMKRSGSTLYYSTNNTAWFSNPLLTAAATPPADADNLTVTDARGYGRDQPDIGAYEEGGTAP